MTTERSLSTGMWIAAAIAIVFGALTVFSGGQVLFGSSAARTAAGNVVPFVLWFNFLSGFAYLAVGLGLVLRKPWASTLAVVLACSIVAVFALFGWHVIQGGAYEMRTVGAMVLRATVWIGIALYLRRLPK